MTIDYSKFTELMSYFHFVFNIYYVLMTILVFNASKAIASFYINRDKSKTSNLYDLIISTLIGFALANALFFHGVISDISEVESDKWSGKVFAICLTAVIVFVVQVAFNILSFQKSNKNDHSILMNQDNNF